MTISRGGNIVTTTTLDGRTFSAMVLLGAHHLTNNAKKIDALNVFPVPDGDTGTNMNLSMTSGVEEVKKIDSNHVSEVASSFAKGLLMGARGNSGVILSQIFRGFASGMENKEIVTTSDLANAFDLGVQTAYKAVMKPVEGTILTVAKDAAKEAVEVAKNEDNVIVLLEKVVAEAKASLKRTPDLLPVLKEVGVVDSGGQGLVTIYEGFLASLKGEPLPEEDAETVNMEEMINAAHHKTAQDVVNTADIKYGYCTEFMIKFDEEKLSENPFEEEAFRNELSEQGDSLLVVSDNEVVKVHVHTEYPGTALNTAQKYGDLINLDIENMREQHSSIVDQQQAEEKKEKAEYAIITVALGSGIKELFESLGAAVVIEGGQTMNPSTLDITNAIKKAHAKNIIILPNNKNIIMAAEQAAEIAEENVKVVTTQTIPQGIGALLVFHPESNLEKNAEAMEMASKDVKTGQVTYAVRNTTIDGIKIEKGNFMGIADSDIKATHKDITETVKLLLEDLIDEEDDEILTILSGEDVTQSEVDELVEYIEERYPEIELEIYDGKQPVYSYIFSVE